MSDKTESDDTGKTDDLFIPDRRVSEREKPTDRRTRLRPTIKLKKRGLIIAVILFWLIIGLIYLISIL